MAEELMRQFADPQRLQSVMQDLEKIISTSAKLQDTQSKLLAWVLFSRKEYGTAILIPIKDHEFTLNLVQKIPGFNTQLPMIIAAMQYGVDIGAFNDAYKLVMLFTQMNNDKRVAFIRDLLKRKQYTDARALITLVKGTEADKLRQQLKSISATSSSSSTSTSLWIKLSAILLGICLLLAISMFMINTM